MTDEEMKSIREQAEKEFKEERRREEIEKIKIKLREHKPFWQKVFPFKIVIVRR